MKRQLGSLATSLLFGVSILGLGATAGAQEAPPQSDPQQQGQNDPGAARISYIQGDVSTQHSDSSEWVAATLNTPVVDGDHVSTGNGARAEIELNHANILRMSDQSTVNVVNLSSAQMQVQVGQGLVNFDMLKDSGADVEIQTPNVAIHPQAGEGSFRILVNSDGETIVDVRKGSADISTPQGSTRVDRDQRITIEGNADNAQYQVSGAPGNDDWDKWNSDRDQMIESAASWHYTNPYYTGSQDLDAYGHWNNVPDYGEVWFPDAEAGWAPYRDGRWVYEPFYGWTWVSYEPWGWAPYHYGRWFVYGGNWGWWPGPVYAGYRPIWAPAYVSFFGFGGGGWGVNVGFGFGGGFGNIGWLPCGPGDRFYPWYGRGVNRVNSINVYNVRNDHDGFAPLRGGGRGFSNVDRAFTDGRVRDGMSSMRSDQFGRGRVPTHQDRIDAGSFRQASLMTGANPVSPTRESFRPSDRQVRSSDIPNRAVTSQRFFRGTARQGIQGQAERGQTGSTRGGNLSGAQSQPNNARPGFRSFGPNNPGNVIPGGRQGGFNPRGNQPQQNTAGPVPEQSGQGFRGFGSNNSGNVNRAPAPQQMARPSQGNSQGQRGYTPPSSRQEPPAPSSRPGWRTFSSPSRQSQPNGNGGGRTFEGQGVPAPQSRANGNYQPARPGYSQPSQPPRQYQNNSHSNSGNSGYSRPPLNMQQPVVTPRGRGSYSPPPARSAPSGGGNSGREYRGGSSGGGSRGNSSSGSSRGGNSGGGHSSGHSRH
jgi:Family of unknown function (DUF6600)/FecR protein